MKLTTKFFLTIMLFAVSNAAIAKPDTTAATFEITGHKLTGFNAIKIAGPFKVFVKQGDNESVRIEATEDVKDRILAEVDGGVLKIRKKHDNWGWSNKSWWNEKGVWNNHRKMLVYITARQLNGISISGSGTITFDNGISTAALKLRVRGSGSLTGKIDVKKLESSISGSGEIKLSGNAEASAVRISGSGSFIARNLVTSTSAIRVSGSSHVEVNASDKVDAIAHGSAGIHYTGAAKVINTSTSGSAEIKRL